MSNITIKLNGQDKKIEEGISIGRLLAVLKIKPGVVVVEHNLNILKRAEHDNVLLKEGDAVEVISFVGGG